jgi:hypothetical protein
MKIMYFLSWNAEQLSKYHKKFCVAVSKKIQDKAIHKKYTVAVQENFLNYWF